MYWYQVDAVGLAGAGAMVGFSRTMTKKLLRARIHIIARLSEYPDNIRTTPGYTPGGQREWLLSSSRGAPLDSDG